jgi:hypothetical protein
MNETFDGICERTLNALLAHVFTEAPNKQIQMEMLYQFADPRVAAYVKEKIADYGVKLHKAERDRKSMVYSVMIEEVMRTKFLTVMRCAKRAQEYRKLGREIDFTLHGYDWKPAKPTSDINDDSLSLCNKIFVRTYGEMKI